jgi:hypothetical protein
LGQAACGIVGQGADQRLVSGDDPAEGVAIAAAGLGDEFRVGVKGGHLIGGYHATVQVPERATL